MNDAIRVAAHAKINLYLHVVGKRADGYHLLDSLVVFAELHDEITVEAADDLSLTIDGPFADALKDESDNLVLRAARALAEATKREPKARIRLTKRIPVSAGIGGGSADAAATLRALADLWQVDIDRAVALKLGADVNVCVASETMFMSGIGETLDLAPGLPRLYLLLVNPGVAVATKDVFKARAGAFSQPARFNVAPRSAMLFARFLLHRKNDLTAAALLHAPAIRTAREAVGATEGCLLARMSGSGATVFGLYASADEAARAAEAVSRDHPEWWVWSGGVREGDNTGTLTRS
ncbi:MAG: 4-(cytidine 5'-diphospho)-2-C-methyl-D-erythritol kinase [Alphaproteobacteria bacterium]|nr:4-(cytidine 5'-diphospho)-2-C-methyl-D-erythritol kinase [Alphaproteobacteria bacterium]